MAFNSNKKNSSLIKLLVGVFLISAFGLIAVLFLLLSSSNNKQEEAKVLVTEEKVPEIKMVSVLVPLKNINPGTVLEPSLFRVEEKAQISVDSGTVTGIATINGKYAKSLIISGVPLHKDLITDLRPISAISSSIPAGYRAVTITVDKRSGVEGWAKPGSKVDVIWASKIRGKHAITTIVQNAKVLSSNQTTQAGLEANAANAPQNSAGPSTVTLLVTVLDAQKIQLASTTGSLSMSLRGDQDFGAASNTSSITIDDLLGLSKGGPKRKIYKGKVTLGGKQWGLDEEGQLIPITEE